MNDIDDPEHIRKLLMENKEPYDPDQSLRRVLAKAHRQSATKDVIGFFMSWIWVLFAGFGASLHKAYSTRQQVPVSTTPRLDQEKKV